MRSRRDARQQMDGPPVAVLHDFNQISHFEQIRNADRVMIPSKWSVNVDGKTERNIHFRVTSVCLTHNDHVLLPPTTPAPCKPQPGVNKHPLPRKAFSLNFKGIDELEKRKRFDVTAVAVVAVAVFGSPTQLLGQEFDDVRTKFGVFQGRMARAAADREEVDVDPIDRCEMKRGIPRK